MKKVFRYLVLVTLVFSAWEFGITATANAQHRRPNPHRRAQMKSDDFKLKPIYAQFMNSEHIAIGDSEGLKIIEIKTGEIKGEFLKGVAVRSLISGAIADSGIYVGAGDGSIHKVVYEDGKFKLHTIEGLDKTSLTVIQTILIKPDNPAMVLFADPYQAVICRVKKDQAEVLNTFLVADKSHLINFAVQDHRERDFFVLDATNGGKYRGSWVSGKVTEIIDESMPHGYSLRTSGVRFIPIGKNAEYILTNYITTVPVFMKQHPNEPNTYLLAGIGKGPLKIRIEPSNFYNLQILSSSQMTYSIDIDPSNDQHMLISNPQGVLLSFDGGRKWKKLKSSI